MNVAGHESLTAEERPRDAEGRLIPAFALDRRTVKRPRSSQSRLSDAIPTYVAKRRLSGGANIARDLSTAESRLALFIELIGDHPVDTYGFDVATEKEARKLKALPLDPEIDYSIFRGLDFDAIARRERAAGPPKRK